MKRLKIFTWHVHGSYLYYLSHIPHDIYLPKKSEGGDGYWGITPSYPWPSHVHEVPFDEVKNHDFDVILYQSHQNYLVDQFEVLSEEQRKLPRVYLEHDPPRESPTETLHPVDDPEVLLVHVTDFNKLMWNCQRTPTTVIDHGVSIPADVHYSGRLQKGLVVVNNIALRGRRLGLDIFENVRTDLDLDLIGMGWDKVGGLGEVSHRDLPYFCSRYRYFFNPIRYTSLGLSILEAMMVGMPIIALATTELVTVVENEKSGFLSTRPSELIEVSKELIRYPDLARRWGEQAKKTCEDRFSINRFVQDWNRVLKEACQGSALFFPNLSLEETWTSP